MDSKRGTGLTLCLLLASAHVASAQTTSSEEAPLWQPQFRKVEPLEYAATAVFGVSTLAISFFVDPPSSGGHGGLLYDDAVRDALRLHTRSGRDAARIVGDIGFRSLLFYPFLDALVTGLAIHRDPEAAWQMIAIDAEVLAFAGFIGVITDHFIGRARPSQPECARDGTYERFCNQPDQYSSFVSGHSVMAAAGAGAICAHHLSMPLYGGGASDVIACGSAIAAALTTGIARITNDRHWATDVSVAFIVGGVAGYVWPKWFHYRAAAKPDGRTALNLHWFPELGPDRVAGALQGTF